MSLRTRMLLAFGIVALIPLALLAFGLRQEMTNRLSEEYQVRVDNVIERIREDLRGEGAGIGRRLESLKEALLIDNIFRLAAVAGVETERDYLLDYAGDAMQLTDLSMLLVLDADGRIVSSGHFRNEHGRVEPSLAPALTAALDQARGGIAFVVTPVPEGEMLSLVRSESLRIGGHTFTLVGGMAVDDAFLARLAGDSAVTVSLRYPGGALSSDPAGVDEAETAPTAEAVQSFEIPLVLTGRSTRLEVVPVHLQVTQSLAALHALQRRVNSLFLLTAAGGGLTALILALWLSSRISRPLAALAAKTAKLDLDRLDVHFGGGNDEVGSLSRLLGDLTSRLRTSTTRMRDAERRATVGELARQINHDIKNGLIPLRNVIRHLEQVEREEPAALASVFAERRQTVDSSIAYLETLANSYKRLSPAPDRRRCDVNALVRDVVRAAQGRDQVDFVTQLAPNLPPVFADPIALRRILENLTTNAVESLQSKPGRVSVSTDLMERNGEPPYIRLTVADTGHGMSREETAKIFNDFYTTKEGGAGLGLSIVRRLVMDLEGSIAVESEPGKGTRFIIDAPAASP